MDMHLSDEHAPQRAEPPAAHGRRAPRVRATLLTLAAIGLVGAAGALGWAYFAAPGAGIGSAAVTSLGTPTAVAVPTSVVGDSVVVSWTGVAAPDGGSSVGYWVRRYAGSTATDACGSSLTSPIDAGSGARSCTDNGVASGDYTYLVTAVFRSWTTTSAASAPVTVEALAPFDHFAIDTPPSATAGSAFAVVVTAEDASGHALSGYTGTISFTSSDAAAALPADYTFAGADNGSHTFPVTAKTAGAQTVSAHDAADSGTNATSATITVTGASLDHFVVAAPANASAGVPFTTASLLADDAYGNAASGWTSATRCVTFTGPTAAPNGTAPSYPAAATCGAGKSSVSFDPSGQATGFSITLFDSETVALHVSASAASGTSAAIVVVPRGLDHFAVVAPASAAVATAFSSATVAARDLYDNAASGWTSATKCVAFSGPGSAPNGTAPNYPAAGACATGQSSLAFDGSGRASGFGITLYKAETHTITAADPASSKTGTSGSVVVASGPAASLAVTTPASANAGTSLSASLTARDAYGNTATGYAGNHTIAWSGPGNAPNGQAPALPATTVTFAAGASTTPLSATLYKAESATLNASDVTGPWGAASITVSPLAASNFLVSAPVSATAGASFAVTLTARDQFGNTATSYAGAHPITLSGPGSSPSGATPTLPTTSASFTGGVSSTPLPATLTKAETATLTASATSPAVSGSATITVDPGAAARLAWSGATVGAGSTSTPCFFTCSWNSSGRGKDFKASIAVTDANGNVVRDLGDGHTVMLAAEQGSTPNPANIMIPAAGPAVTPSFTITTRSGNNWSTDTFTASSAGLTSATVSVSK